MVPEDDLRKYKQPEEGAGNAAKRARAMDGSGGEAYGGKGTRNGKGSASRGGYKGKGKGKEAEIPVDTSTNGILATHAKIILRLEQDRRERNRVSQWVFGIQPEAEELREILAGSAEVWRSGLQERAPHPDGPLHWVQFRCIVEAVGKALGEQEMVTSEQKRDLREWTEWVQLAAKCIKGWKEGSIDTRGVYLVCHKCQPLGNKKRGPQEGLPWLFLVAFNMGTARGREIHELTFAIREGVKRTAFIDIRPDRSPTDGLEEQVRLQLEHLQV